MKTTIANHSELLVRVNLQHFGEEEDFILPEDYSEPVEEVTSEEEPFEGPVNEEVETNEPEETEPTPEEVEAFLKIKYNKEEIPLDEEKARELAQMGMNYPKLQEKIQSYENDPRLAFVDELANEYGMSPEELITQIRQQREQDRLNELIQQNIPQELAQEILENRKFRQMFEHQQQQTRVNQMMERDFQDFLQEFPNVDPKEIPKEVWETHAQGVPLRFAYLQHDYQNTKKQIKVLQQNQENHKKAPIGSVTAHGSQEVASEDNFLKGFNSVK